MDNLWITCGQCVDNVEGEVGVRYPFCTSNLMYKLCYDTLYVHYLYIICTSIIGGGVYSPTSLLESD